MGGTLAMLRPMRPAPLMARLAVVGLALGALAGCTKSDAGRASGPTIAVSVSRCGTGWEHPAAGPQHFVMSNTDSRAGEAQLADAATGAIYADVEPLGPGTRTTLDVDLGAGRYQFRCAMDDEPMVMGPTVTIGGTAKGTTPAVLPITQAQLIPATKRYERYVSGQLPGLARAVSGLQASIDAGDRGEAEARWLPAHLAYERLGAAYDAFGDYDAQINGTADGLPRGVHDPSWAGFHRLEYGLWHGASMSSLRKPAHTLASSVDALGHFFATQQIDPLQIGLRSHEITENAVQFELTGTTDYGSHSNLATVDANLAGTRTTLGIVHPLLAPRDPQTPAIDAALAQARSDLAALREPEGTWPALEALTRPQRERVDADLSSLAELLSSVATVLEPRRGPS